MLGELFKIVGKVFVQTDEAKAQLDDVSEEGQKASKKLDGFFGGVAKAGALVAAGVTAAYGGAMALTNQVAQTADKWDKLSLRTGIAVENLQAWGYAAEQSGADIGKLEVGIKTLSESQVRAMEGNEDAIASYQKLGISIEDLANMTPEQTFEAVMNGLAGMKDGAEKNSIGNQLLGKSFVELKPLLAEGVDGMQALKDRASELGLILSEDTVNAGVEFGDRMADLQAIIGSFGNEIAAQLMPHMTDFINWCIENAPKIKETIGNVVEGVTGAVKFLGQHMKLIIPIASGLVGAFAAFKIISTVTTMVTAFKTIIGGASTVMGIFNAVMAANPITLVVLAIGALIAAGVALYMNWEEVTKWAGTLWENLSATFNNIKDSVVGFISGMVEGVAAWFTAMWTDATTKAQEIFNAIVEWFGQVPGKIEELWQTAEDFLTTIDLLQAGKDVIQGFIDGIGEMAGALWEKAGEVAGGVWDKFQSLFNFGSPSKTMRQAGKWVVQGQIIGMEDEESNLQKTAEKLAKVGAFTTEADYTFKATPATVRATNMTNNDMQQRAWDYVIRLLEQIAGKDPVLVMDGHLVAETIDPHAEYIDAKKKAIQKKLRGER